MKGISRHTDYAARIVLHLAAAPQGQLVTVEELADRGLIPGPFARRLVPWLTRAGIVETVRGAGGGVRLGRPAEQISLGDVVRAMEGGVTLNQCVEEPESCPLTTACPVHQVWSEVTRELEARLDATRFSDLARTMRST